MQAQRLAEVEDLKLAGYVATEEETNEIVDIVSTNPKTGLLWVSNVTKLPIAKIMIIVDDLEDYTIVDEYVVNKKMVDVEIAEKVFEGTCQSCGNPYEPDNVYCLNCGVKLEIVEKTDTLVTPITPEDSTYQTPSYPVPQQEVREEADVQRAYGFNFISLFALINLLVAIVYYVIDVILPYNLNGLIIGPILGVTSIIFAAMSLRHPTQKILGKIVLIAGGVILLAAIIYVIYLLL
ncbi:MAG: hypothetical protein FK733_04375 [Asgard group archaeon]|nr:hypothetical protein [Asgard group archaeon]